MEDQELKAMSDIFSRLDPLSEEARIRVLAWVMDRLQIKNQLNKGYTGAPKVVENTTTLGLEFKTFADLYNSASPITQSDKALVAGYWLQVVQGNEEFPSQAANKELQNLGHLISNITDAFSQLKDKKPALAIQVKKSGKSQQARKQYKLTQAGIDVVKTMIKQTSNFSEEK